MEYSCQWRYRQKFVTSVDCSILEGKLYNNTGKLESNDNPGTEIMKDKAEISCHLTILSGLQEQMNQSVD